jgi:4-aminobutyrate aminotransferase/4-aminobutyrate aminotransferase/(S)-3-amino-2-methylpropionate transaminase
VELSQPDGSPATDAALRIIKVLLQQGFILLPEGKHSNVISFAPPLIISKKQLETVVNAFRYVLGKLR